MTPQDAEAYVVLAARLAGLELSDASREAVTANTLILHRMAAAFVDIELPEAVDPAGLLRP